MILEEDSLEIQLTLESSHLVPSCLSKAGCLWVLWPFLIYELTPPGVQMYFPTCPTGGFILNMSVTESFIFPPLLYW